LVLGRHNWRAESPEVPHNPTDSVRLYIYENDSGYSYDKGFPLPKRLGEKTVLKTVEKFESWFVKARNSYDKCKREGA
jgi:hypothetical protein